MLYYFSFIFAFYATSLRTTIPGLWNKWMTFRLDENVIATLCAQCERRHISLSNMINQILR